MSKFTTERSAWGGTRAEKQLNDRADRLAEWRDRQLNRIAKPFQVQQPTTQEPAAPSASAPTSQPKPWGSLKAGTSGLRYFWRTTPDQALAPQPWTLCLVDTILEAADKRTVHLCLIWPARPTSIVLLHAMATLERSFARDLRGLRSVLFPGTNVSRSILHGALLDRRQASDFYRCLWTKTASGTAIQSHTSSASYVAMLSALNDLECRDPDLPNPSLGEVVPSFMFDGADMKWKTVVENPLERSIRKVDNRSQRKLIRESVRKGWGAIGEAPGAMLVIHGSTKKEQWRAALGNGALPGNAKPEVFLLDALSSGNDEKQKAVRRIPEFLK